MDDVEILLRLGLALAIGFLIGVERGWRQRDEAEGERAAGLRTFTLVGLSGGVFALLSGELGPIVLAVGFAATAGTIVFFRWRETEHEGGFGATTVVAALLTFALGAYAVVGDRTAAAAAAVAMAAILAAKGWLHAWLRALTWEELRAALILAAMSLVVLPVLPDRGYGPYEALNPRELWLMTIAIAGVSFVGYVAVKVAGMRYGPLIVGVAGGVVSSTVTTLDLARRAKTATDIAPLIAGALAASATMFARVLIVVALFGPALLPEIAWPLVGAFLVLVIAAIGLDQPWTKSPTKGKGDAPPVTNPFELKTVAAFALLLAVITLIAAWLTHAFGGGGGVVLAAIAGLADVDAVVLSMTRLATAGDVAAAEIAILTAVAVNSVSKSVLAFTTGGPKFGMRYAAATAVALLVGVGLALATPFGV